MKNKDTGVDSRYQKMIREGNSEKGIGLLVAELEALLTIPNEFCLFERIHERTLGMFKKEPSLRKHWKKAIQRCQKVDKERNSLLVEINKYVEELQLDKKLRSLRQNVRVWTRKDGKILLEKGNWKKSWEEEVPPEISDKWILEVKEWVEEQVPKIKMFSLRGEKILRLQGLISQWECAEPTWFPIGENFVISLARLISVSERIAFFFKNESGHSLSCSLRTRSLRNPPVDPLYEAIKEIREEVLMVCKNLIAELPLIRSWGDFSSEAITWKRIAEDMAMAVWMRDRTKSVAEIVRTIYPRLRRWGIQESTVEKYLMSIDMRTPEERKLSQRRKPKIKEV